MELAPPSAPAREPADLRTLRDEIDHLDRQILDLMARRLQFARATLPVKAIHGLGLVDTRREAEVVRVAATRARERGLHAELVREIFWRIIEVSKTTGAP